MKASLWLVLSSIGIGAFLALVGVWTLDRSMSAVLVIWLICGIVFVSRRLGCGLGNGMVAFGTPTLLFALAGVIFDSTSESRPFSFFVLVSPFMFASTVFAIGWVFGTLGVGGRRQTSRKTVQQQGVEQVADLPAVRAQPIIGALLVVLFMFVVGYGPMLLLLRDDYIPRHAMPGLLSIASLIAAPLAALAALSARSPHTRAGERTILRLSIGMLILALLAASSRSSIVVLSCYLLTGAATHPSSRLRAVRVGVASLVILGTLPVPLFTRSLDAHGLGPYSAYLIRHPTDPWIERPPTQLVLNVTEGFEKTSLTIDRSAGFPPDLLSTSLRIDPAAQDRWAEIASEQRVNRFVPFSGLGELIGAGLVWAALILFVFGWAYALLESLNTRAGGASKIKVFSLAALSIFALVQTQYNLQGVSRIAYLSLALLAVSGFKARAGRRRRRPHLAPTLPTIRVGSVSTR